MESGHVSGTDPTKNHQAPNSSENKSSSPHSLTSSGGRPAKGTPAIEQQHDGSSPLPTSDRIPSHVFSITSTTTETEWSVASNDSLFSIQSGSTSFSKEQLSSINISSPLLELPRTTQFTDFDMKSGNLDEAPGAAEFGVTESAMREVSMEQECQQKDETPVEFSPHSGRLSTHSDASEKSFAFPILTAEGTKNKKERLQISTSLEENTYSSQEPEDSQETIHKTQTQISTKNAGLKKWFGCFSCGSSSS